MADTDSDSEIHFNIANDVDEEGQGDMIQLSSVPRLNLYDPDDVPRRESPLPSPIPALVPEPQVVRDQRARDRPNEMFASMYSNRSPDRRHEAGDHVRSRSAGARFYPQRYIKPVPKATVQQHRRVQVKPEFYNGEDDWDQYIAYFQNCADFGHWSETHKQLILPACLKSQARAFNLGLSPEDQSSYHRLVQKLSERFGSVRQQSRYLTKFETSESGSAETIASLVNDLRLLAQRAYPDLGTDAQESLALHLFYKAITLEMKCRCIDRGCRTIESAEEIVERYGAILGEGTEKKNIVRATNDTADLGPSNYSRYHQNRNNNKSKSNDRSQAQDTNEPILNQILERLEIIERCLQSNGAKDSSRRQTVRRGVGFICQSPQHFLQDCPVYKKCIDEFQASNGQESGNENPSALY